MTWLIYIEARTSLLNSRYTMEAKATDEIIELGSYDPAFSTFVYGIIVDTKKTILNFSNLPLNAIYKDFSNFRMWIVFGYILIPSSDIGAISSINSHQTRVNDEQMGDGHNEPVPSLLPEEFIQHLWNMMTHLSEYYYSRVDDWCSKNKEGGELDAVFLRSACHSWVNRPPTTSLEVGEGIALANLASAGVLG